MKLQTIQAAIDEVKEGKLNLVFDEKDFSKLQQLYYKTAVLEDSIDAALKFQYSIFPDWSPVLNIKKNFASLSSPDHEYQMVITDVGTKYHDLGGIFKSESSRHAASALVLCVLTAMIAGELE